ncbi:CobW family GTP-binding protein [Allopusillimonas ginsengisoli]|uniref:CobW family GTP-binding protein n=1 Tax=Allopusillimonas ginsengisoli TaxID=453575 RepID=UPI00101F7A4E|nr:GTP-binding protein [Allopusillimonas ginsengisoli]TEA80059.1 GTP-binding protein [Allopusillimonas ginsengisoli]
MIRIPLIVLGGFLGAGKTTLLNHMLSEAGGRRIAVMVNDFGPINVDAALIAEHDGETISLTNGCICCSIGSGLDAALMQVLERQPAPELIVIEASGVSDPGRIAQVGMSDPMLQLEAIVVMADAEHLPGQLDDPLLADTVARQIEAAGVVVLNKIDLVSAEDLSALKQRLVRQFGAIPAIEARHGRLPIEALSGQPAQLERLRQRNARTAQDAESPHPHSHPHEHAIEADHPFEGGSWSGAGIFNADQLIQALKQLPRSVIRVKGWVVTDRHGPAIVHLAGRRVRVERLPATQVIAMNELVYIGLKGEKVQAVMEQALGALVRASAH